MAERGDLAGGVGDPVQDLVVEGQQDPVGGEVHVGLEVAVAQLDGVLEGRQGVLQPLDLGVVGPAAVGEGDDPATAPGGTGGAHVEVGMARHR